MRTQSQTRLSPHRGDAVALYQIDAGYFCAGIGTDDQNRVVEAAPILRYMVGWSLASALDYSERKGWAVTPV
jgi:hypothetical protein